MAVREKLLDAHEEADAPTVARREAERVFRHEQAAALARAVRPSPQQLLQAIGMVDEAYEQLLRAVTEAEGVHPGRGRALYGDEATRTMLAGYRDRLVRRQEEEASPAPSGPPPGMTLVRAVRAFKIQPDGDIERDDKGRPMNLGHPLAGARPSSPASSARSASARQTTWSPPASSSASRDAPRARPPLEL